MRSKVLVILFLILIVSETCFAHANEYSQEAGGEYASELGNEHSEHDNMYAVSEEQSSSDDLMDHSLGRSEFIEEEPIHEEESEKKMDHQEGSHSKHVEIKISEHKLVSTSQKGYGSAAGITLVAGLAFGIVIMRRS
jgi:hypothetical protein